MTQLARSDDSVSTVLLVHDDATLRDIIRDALDLEGYQVLLAENGRQALDILSRMHADVIVLDGRMPVMDGWAFLEEYRARPGPQVPTISMSMDNRPLPTDAEVSKPFDLNNFLDVLAQSARRDKE